MTVELSFDVDETSEPIMIEVMKEMLVWTRQGDIAFYDVTLKLGGRVLQSHEFPTSNHTRRTGDKP